MPVKSTQFLLRSVTVAFILAALALPAQAGTPDTPEMPDAAGDACLLLDSAAPCVPLTGMPATADALDVVASWVDAPDADHLNFSLQVGEPTPVAGAGVGGEAPMLGCLSAAGDLEYEVHFRTRTPDGTLLAPTDPDGNELTDLFVQARLSCDTAAQAGAMGWEFVLAYTYDGTAGSTISTQAVNGSVADGVFSWTVDRAGPLVALPAGDAAAGHKVTDLVAISAVGFSVVAGSGGFQADAAPDAGFGIDYVFAAAPSAPPAEAPTTATGSTVTSTTTVTTVQTQTRTMTVEREVTFTSTPFPVHVEAKGAAGLGLPALLLGLALVVLVGRSRLR